VTSDPTKSSGATRRTGDQEVDLASFPHATVVQLVHGDGLSPDATVVNLHPANVLVTDRRVVAADGESSWSWLIADLEMVIHGSAAEWTILVVPEIPDFGVAVAQDRVDEFRRLLAEFPGIEIRYQDPLTMPTSWGFGAPDGDPQWLIDTATLPVAAVENGDMQSGERRTRRFGRRGREPHPHFEGESHGGVLAAPGPLTGIEARDISAWFGTHQVLDRVSLDMAAGEVTALIGPSGCGKSTFLRILNRMHEMIPSASLAGEVLVDDHDIYDPTRKLTDARREIGMVFQKPNPFPAMSIYDNVLASLRLTGVKASVEVKDEIVESCLTKAGLWKEVQDRLRAPGGGLSGGQQQRLCIARALAIRPRVLLMDEPCSALDPTSTRRIEETVVELVSEVTIVIVTHNMQQAQRVSNRCAFFLAEQGTPGVIVEHGPTAAMFGSPQDQRTLDYVNGRFG
jgi:phosphate transport system ATP-binding protein